MAKAKQEDSLTSVPTYSVDSILQSDRYGRYADLLRTVMDTDKEYSFEEVDSLIQDELSRPVTVDIN